MLAEAWVERFGPVDASNLVDVPKALRRDQRRFGALALDDGIYHDRGAMDQEGCVAEWDCCLRQAFLDTSRQLARCGQRLRQRHGVRVFVKENNVCERTANVDPNAQDSLLIVLAIDYAPAPSLFTPTLALLVARKRVKSIPCSALAPSPSGRGRGVRGFEPYRPPGAPHHVIKPSP